MDTVVPRGFAARPHPNDVPRKTRKRRLHLRIDGETIPVTDLWAGGFSTASTGPRLARGYVDLFDGATHISHGLAYLASVEKEARVYAFKQVRKADLAPPTDHVRVTPAPAGLISLRRG